MRTTAVAAACCLWVVACSSKSDVGPDAGPDAGIRDSGPPPLGVGLITVGLGSGNGLTATATHVIYADSGRGIYAIDRISGVTNRLYLKFSIFEYPDEVVADEAAVYWSDLGANRLLRLPLLGASPVPIVVSTPFEPNGLKLLRDKLYWASNGGVVGWTTVDGGTERRFPVGGTPSELDADESAIYYTDMSGPPGPTRAVFRVDLQTGVVSALARQQGSLGRIVADQTFVYWGADEDNDGGTVSRTVKTGGGPVEVVARAPLPVVALALRARSSPRDRT